VLIIFVTLCQELASNYKREGLKRQCSRSTERIALLLVAKLVLREITIAMLKLVVLVCLVALGAAQTPVKPKLPETFISQVRAL